MHCHGPRSGTQADWTAVIGVLAITIAKGKENSTALKSAIQK